MRLHRLLLPALAASLLAAAATALSAAAGELHGYSVVEGELLRYDLLSGEYETIGPTGIDTLGVISLADGDGDFVFGVGVDSYFPWVESLYRFELATGQGSQIGHPGFLPGSHLARTADGTFYNAHIQGAIYRVDPATSTSTLLIDIDRSIWSLAAKGDLLYVSYVHPNHRCEIAVLDPADPVLVPLGQYQFCADTAAIGRHDGNLYFASELVDPWGSNRGTKIERFDLNAGPFQLIAEWFGPAPPLRPMRGLAGVTGSDTVDIPAAGPTGLLLFAAALAAAALLALRASGR